MSIDIENEELICLSDVPKLPFVPRRNGKKIHIATLYRWTMGARKGIRVETLKVGGTLCTSVAALQRFFDALIAAENRGWSNPTPASHANDPLAGASLRRRRELEKVERELDEIFNEGKAEPPLVISRQANRLLRAV